MKKLRYSIFTLLALALGACQSFVENVGEYDPTLARDADINLVVTAMEVEYMGTMEGDLARTAGMWSGHFTGIDRQYSSLNNYISTTTDYVTAWNNIYAFVLKQSRIVQTKATVLNDKVTLGIAQVVEAHIIGTSAALWGDVPYRQANDPLKYPNPAYDPQAQVFSDVLALLDVAIANIGSNSGSRNGDFLGSSNAQWLAVAHSLKARYYLYQKDYTNALAEAASGVSSNAGNLMGKHGTTNDQDRNIFYDFQIRQRVGYMAASNAMLPKVLSTAAGNRNNLKTDESKRLGFYYSGTAGSYNLNTSATGMFASNAGFPLVTFAETQLIAAEAEAKKNGLTATALNSLNAWRAALQAQFPTGKYTAYLATDFTPVTGIENADGIAAVDAFIREVREEKWVSLIGQIEVFNELRRTNNSVNVPVNTGTQIPQRYLYSQGEINSNTSTPNPIPGLFDKTSIFQ